MIIRKAKPDDEDRIFEILDAAKAFMRSTGNTSQWDEEDYPGNMIKGDIAKGYGHVVEENGVVRAYLALIEGADPTYANIEGKWLNDAPYAVIHRVASDGKCHNILEAILEYAFSLIDNVRIDTHEDNGPMRHKLEKNGFTYCGTIYVSDGTPRRAYQKIGKK